MTANQLAAICRERAAEIWAGRNETAVAALLSDCADEIERLELEVEHWRGDAQRILKAAQAVAYGDADETPNVIQGSVAEVENYWRRMTEWIKTMPAAPSTAETTACAHEWEYSPGAFGTDARCRKCKQWEGTPEKTNEGL